MVQTVSEEHPEVGRDSITPVYGFTLYAAGCRGNAQNNRYPRRGRVTGIHEFTSIMEYDHVAAQFRDNQRGNDNFICSDCKMFDVDNADTDTPGEWISPADVRAAFPGVPFYVCYSRNHMKEKNRKAPRPKFHVYFPDAPVNDGEEYGRQKDAVCAHFTAFDRNARDVGRFFFGVNHPQTEYYEGDLLLSDFMETVAPSAAEPLRESELPGVKRDKNQRSNGGITTKFNSTDHNSNEKIPEGQRNATMSRFAARMLKRYGDTDGKAYKAFMKEADKCDPPLCEKELDTIWSSAMKFFRQTVQTDPEYVPPQEYVAIDFANSLQPADLTDVGQARVLAREYDEMLRFSRATKYLFYTGTVWMENEIKAHGLAQDLTERQLREARAELKKAQAAEDKAAQSGDEKKQKDAKEAVRQAEAYRSYVISRRRSDKITASLKEAQPMLEIEVDRLDADQFKLNTPAGTVDLRTRQINAHDPKDYCTKITAVSPGYTGTGLFMEFLDVITCGDRDLEDYLQLVAGMFAVGAVFCENLVIAYGGGRNGKSTFINLLARILGDYSGNLSAETLTVNCRKNKSPEYAELRGKRLVIAAELEEGMRLDTAIVKKLCSTDPIYAEKKYKDPFSFTPSHTVVLYTNHLPRVGTSDAGTWRRLIVVPFKAVIEGNADIRNYADYLFHNAGEAVLTWIIEGAEQFIKEGYRIKPPLSVTQAIESYRIANDWLNNYLSERCETDKTYKEKSGELYADYRDYCSQTGEYTRGAADFKAAIEGAGYETKKIKTASFVYGLRVAPDFSEPL